jgi:two-component sensor histidine kinase
MRISDAVSPLTMIVNATLFAASLSVWLVFDSALDKARARQDAALNAHAADIKAFLDTRQSVVRTLASAIEVPPLDRPRPLTTFAARASATLPYSLAMGWVARVEHAGLPTALTSLQDTGLVGQERLEQLRVSEPLRLRYLVMDVWPLEGNQSLLGVDAASIANRNQTLQRAKDVRDVVASEPTVLIQEPAAIGIILYAPVYADKRQMVPDGFLTVGYRLDALLGGAIRANPLPDDTVITIRYRETGDLTLFQSAPAAVPTLFETSRRQVDFAGQPLMIEYRSSPRHAVAFYDVGWFMASLLALAGIVVFSSLRITRAARFAAEQVAFREEAQKQLKIVVAELDHRISNLFQSVQAIVQATARETPADTSPSIVANKITSRLNALSAPSHLLRKGITDLRITQLISTALAADKARAMFSGPELLLNDKAAQCLSLLLHELLTNALKHGALSAADGHVRLAWEIRDQQRFCLSWIELGGPEVKPPEREGFGSKLLMAVIPSQIKGTAYREFVRGGFTYTLSAPLSELEREGNVPENESTEIRLGVGPA